MVELFWLLLPVAAGSGYYAAAKNLNKKIKNKPSTFNYNHNYIKGLNYVLNDDTDKAIDVFIDLLSLDQDTVETHMALASLFRRRGEVERAIRIHQNIIARPNLSSQQRLDGLIELGYDYLCLGVLDRAENIFNDIVKQHPNNKQVLHYLLDIYQQQSEWMQAVEIAKLLNKYNYSYYSNNIAQYYTELANIKLEHSNVDEAYYFITQALKYNPDNIRANLVLADICIKKGQVKKSIKTYINISRNNKHLEVILPKLITTDIQFSVQSNYVINTITQLVNSDPRLLNIPSVLEFLLDRCGFEYTWGMLTSSVNGPVKINLVSSILELIGSNGFKQHSDYELIKTCLDNFEVTLKKYKCNNCGFYTNELLWLCPSCRKWDSISNINFSV